MSVRDALRRGWLHCALFMMLTIAPARGDAVDARRPSQKWLVDGAVAALSDPDDEVKVKALARLGALKEPATAEIIAGFLDKRHPPGVRGAALRAYASLHLRDRAHLPEIAAYLAPPLSSDSELLAAALEAISAMGADQQYRPQIVNLLDQGMRDKSEPAAGVRPGMLLAALARGGSLDAYRAQVLALFKLDGVWAAAAISESGSAAAYLPQLKALLSTHRYSDWAATWQAISSAHLAKDFLPQIDDFLRMSPGEFLSVAGVVRAIEAAGLDQTYRAQIRHDMNPDSVAHPSDFGELTRDLVRFEVIEAIASSGAAAQYSSEINQALRSKRPRHVNSLKRREAIEAVAATGLTAFHRSISDALASGDDSDANGALDGIASARTAAQYLPEISALLRKGPPVHGILAALGSAVCDLDFMVAQVAPSVYSELSQTGTYRFIVYSCGGGKQDARLLAALLPRGERRKASALVPGEADRRRAFALFEHLAALPGLPYEPQPDIAARLAELAELVPWIKADLGHLRKTRDLLYRAGFHAEARVLEARVHEVEGGELSRRTLFVLLAHASFWFALIALYPRSRMVQAIFFWNPWVRRILGFGYVGFLLTWVPLLRNRLLAPFRDSLLADARLLGFSADGYFTGSTMRDASTDKTLAVAELLATELTGQVVIEGESGLGKTMLLRHLAFTARRPVAFLPAASCAGGVLPAVQEKLQGKASDAAYLRNLIWAGAVDLYIDGLNEVTADTRATITHFMTQFSKGDIVVATQALEWSPPGTARTYVLQPLDPSCIRAFLALREPRLPADAHLRGKDYEDACARFLATELNSQQPPEELEAAMRVLSNPMDLTTVAEMIARGQEPDLFHLQKQQYELMKEDFARTHNREFPLRDFSEEVYRMRLADRRELTPGPFGAALGAMERFKMVLRREEKSGEPVWLFRHDRVMDFFLVHAFLGADNARPEAHLADPRFRGVYLMLAILLPYDEALCLRELLILHAASSKDHTVSDSFVQLLHSRRPPKAA
jgi:hypothetical protein